MREIWRQFLTSADLIRKPSLLLIIFSAIFAFWFVDFWKPYNTAKGHHNFNSDVTNYYSYLPAYFCNNGSFDFGWGADSLYLPVGPRQTFVPKCTYGMAAMYAPFFALGYKIAINQEDRLDGFSEAFATSVRWGSIFYVLLGLWFLRKLLLKNFNEVVTAFTLLAVLFGSILFNYTFVQSEFTHGYLFCLFSIFLYLTSLWHGRQRYLYSFLIGLVITLVSLVRPTEVYIFLFFILWNIKSTSDIKSKFRFLLSNYKHFLLMLGIGILLWIPQFAFWKIHTGSYYFYPYHQEHFFWSDPQVFNLLFSYRKGWITYTPVVLLAFAGFITLKKAYPVSRWSFLFVTALTVYILSSWWDWSYGGCFGARALCQHIAFLAIPMASFIDFAFYSVMKSALRAFLSLIVSVFLFSCVCLNIGQTYQSKHTLLHPWGTSRQLYWYVFRKYQFSDKFEGEWWSKVRPIDHEKWMRGEGRDDK